MIAFIKTFCYENIHSEFQSCNTCTCSCAVYHINIKLLRQRLCEVSDNKGFYERLIFCVFVNSFGIKNTQRSS